MSCNCVDLQLKHVESILNLRNFLFSKKWLGTSLAHWVACGWLIGWLMGGSWVARGWVKVFHVLGTWLVSACTGGRARPGGLSGLGTLENEFRYTLLPSGTAGFSGLGTSCS